MFIPGRVNQYHEEATTSPNDKSDNCKFLKNPRIRAPQPPDRLRIGHTGPANALPCRLPAREITF